MTPTLPHPTDEVKVKMLQQYRTFPRDSTPMVSPSQAKHMCDNGIDIPFADYKVKVHDDAPPAWPKSVKNKAGVKTAETK